MEVEEEEAGEVVKVEVVVAVEVVVVEEEAGEVVKVVKQWR